MYHVSVATFKHVAIPFDARVLLPVEDEFAHFNVTPEPCVIVSDVALLTTVITAPISPGHQITSSDVSVVHMNLDVSSKFYLSNSIEPLGMISTRLMHAGEIIGNSDLTSAIDAMSTSAVPISVRSVDVATGLNMGENVDIYWVLDTQIGENSIDPILILGGVTLLSIDDGGKNFGSDTGLSVAVEETQVLRLLSATTQGRLVVIRSHV